MKVDGLFFAYSSHAFKTFIPNFCHVRFPELYIPFSLKVLQPPANNPGRDKWHHVTKRLVDSVENLGGLYRIYLIHSYI